MEELLRMKRMILGSGIAWAVSACLCAGQVVTTDLLIAFDANDDTDPNNGWDYTGAMGPGTLSNGGQSGPLSRVQDPNGQFFFRKDSATDHMFQSQTANTTTIGDWSAEIWIRRTGANSENHVFRVSETGFPDPNAPNQFLNSSAPGLPDLSLDHRAPSSSTGDRTTNIGVHIWGTDSWEQWVFTYSDGPNGTLTMYVNNTLTFSEITQNPVNNNSRTINTVALFGIRRDGESNRGMIGDIAVFRFYGKVLTTGEVDQNFNATGAGLGLIMAPLPPPGIAAVAVADQVGHRFTGEEGVLYELHGSDDGTNFTATGAMVRGTGAEQDAFDPSGTQKAAYQLVPQR